MRKGGANGQKSLEGFLSGSEGSIRFDVGRWRRIRFEEGETEVGKGTLGVWRMVTYKVCTQIGYRFQLPIQCLASIEEKHTAGAAFSCTKNLHDQIVANRGKEEA